jgi:DNA polymerase III subunit beta
MILADALAPPGVPPPTRTGTLPVLSGVRLELRGDELTVTGTDLELTIRSGPVAGDRDGAAVLPAASPPTSCGLLPNGKVEVDVGDDEAASAPGAPVQRAPAAPTTTRARRVRRRAGHPVAAEWPTPSAGRAGREHRRARPILTGVLLAAESDGLRLVATDSYRLAVRDLPGVSVLGADQQVLVPSGAQRAPAHPRRREELTLRLGERDATFEAGSTRLTTRLIEGEFPNYRQLIPSSTRTRSPWAARRCSRRCAG